MHPGPPRLVPRKRRLDRGLKRNGIRYNQYMARPHTRPTKRFNGNVYSQRDDGYYERYKGTVNLGTRRRFLMHRDVWEHHNGPIPEGMEIHHVDHDRGNNDISNLRCLSTAEHASEHSNKGWAGWSREDRSKRSNEMWGGREPREIICANCGTAFMSTGMRAKYCSLPCNKRHNRARSREQERQRYDPKKRREKYERSLRRKNGQE